MCIVRTTREAVTWAKRAVVAIVLVGAAVIPGRASNGQPRHCAGPRCTTAGSILWAAALPGLWLARPGVSGTAPADGGAYAATGGGLAVIGTGTTVIAFDDSTGKQSWRVTLAWLPAGWAVVGVRAFQGIIAVGVAPSLGPSSTAPGQSGAGRREVMLSAATGRQIRSYPAATYGGAVAASRASTVIVGARAITAYDNATGRVRWSRAIGATGQTWRVTGNTIYVTADGASAGVAGRVALRRIDLRTGAQRIVHIQGTAPGSLTDAVGNVVLFSGADGVRAYQGSNGTFRWRDAAEVELVDSGQDSVYLASGNRLLGVSLPTGKVLSSAPISVAASLYGVADGVALGLDENGVGDAWGYDLQTRRIVWTSGPLPWPHFFVDLSGLGGSLSPGGTIALLATCTDVGSAANATAAPACRRPELEAVRI